MTAQRKPYVGYIRVSAVGRRKGDRFHSPDEQAAAIRTWAAEHGEQVEILAPELNAKGSDRTRPMLSDAIDGCESGKYAGLVVAYLSRVARSAQHTLEIYERIEAAGGRVVAIAENIDTSTVDGRMTRTIHAAIAQAELERHAERFAALRQSTLERGIWKQRQTPRGYDRDPLTRKLIPNDDADLVRELFRLRAISTPWSELSRRTGMTTSGLRYLVRNRVYLGELRSGEEVNPAAHPPLVTPSEWEAAQWAIRAPRRGNLPAALLGGLVRCGSCGRIASRAMNNRARGGFAYICHNGNPCPHHASAVMVTLDELVERVALQELRLLAASPMSGDDERARLDKAVAAAGLELATYIEAVSAASVGAEAYATGAQRRRAALDEARAARGALRDDDAPSDLLQRWGDMDNGERNTTLRGMFEAVVLWPAGRGPRVPLESRCQILYIGSDVVSDFRRMPEVRRPAIPIMRLDDSDPRLAGPRRHDPSERVSAAP